MLRHSATCLLLCSLLLLTAVNRREEGTEEMSFVELSICVASAPIWCSVHLCSKVLSVQTPASIFRLASSVKNKRESKPARRNTLKKKKEIQARKTRKKEKRNSQEKKQSQGNE
jgi:hypothetical protein